VESAAKDFTLADDEVLVPADSDGSGDNQGEMFSVQSLSEVVRWDIRALGRYDRYLMESTRRKVYYSVEHALGEGGDEWTEEELSKIGERERLEGELGERYNRLGAFSLEEALGQYFSPQFTARILEGRSPADLERIEGWVVYTRRAEGLKSPSGFLRSRIESDEQPPQT